MLPSLKQNAHLGIWLLVLALSPQKQQQQLLDMKKEKICVIVCKKVK